MLKTIFMIFGRLWRAVKKRLPVFAGGFAFAIICFISLNAAMVPVSKSEYCGGECHEMNTAYQSWELSSHGSNTNGIRVDCIECHLPPKDDYFTHITAKAYEGGKDIYKHYFGGEYEVEKIRQKVLHHMGNERCSGCHDNLLAKPGSTKAWIAHIISLNQPNRPESRCVKCHENVGHQRYRKIFSP
ncbi:cytochrome c3 family protein [Planctomycetota bacterium]